jgi:8-oxo-dGTP pyrophosphatase MutT (NUDIX family)
MGAPMNLLEAFRDRLAGGLDPPTASPEMEGLPIGTSLAAVLVPVLTASAEPRLVFTRRTDTLSRHAGEISFPGGLADPDEDLPSTALREAEEELGLLPTDVELVGALPPIHTRVTGILIAPYVGLLHADPGFTPNAAEIADVLEFPVAKLEAAGTEREFEHDGRTFRTFVYDMGGEVIWGATAWILRSFLEVVAAPDGGRDG